MTQAGKPIYLVANWKSHKTYEEAKNFVTGYNQTSNHQVILCPAFPYIFPLAEIIANQNIPLTLGAQDISNFPYGAYTGAVAVEMVKEKIKYVIVGHSERRQYFKETNEIVASKARLALDSGLTPIVCVDEPYAETLLSYFTAEELKRIVIAYEPLSAIGSGKPDTPEQADAVAQSILEMVKEEVPILYGGSVNANNVTSFINTPHISGVLVGGASLDLNEWKSLVAAVN